VRSRSSGVDVYRRRKKQIRRGRAALKKFLAPKKASVVMAAHRQIERSEQRFFRLTLRKMRQSKLTETPATEPVKPMQPFPEIL
jgi:hypothetical protein